MLIKLKLCLKSSTLKRCQLLFSSKMEKKFIDSLVPTSNNWKPTLKRRNRKKNLGQILWLMFTYHYQFLKVTQMRHLCLWRKKDFQSWFRICWNKNVENFQFGRSSKSFRLNQKSIILMKLFSFLFHHFETKK